jgi:hypothetical protein
MLNKYRFPYSFIGRRNFDSLYFFTIYAPSIFTLAKPQQLYENIAQIIITVISSANFFM